MKDARKLTIVQMFAVFTAITLITLLFTWGYRINVESKETMMSKTIGDMMTMHGKNITLQDLLKQKEMKPAQGTGNIDAQHSLHHDENGGWMKNIHYLTTITIIMLLPFIIAGSIFLFVEWLK